MPPRSQRSGHRAAAARATTAWPAASLRGLFMCSFLVGSLGGAASARAACDSSVTARRQGHTPLAARICFLVPVQTKKGQRFFTDAHRGVDETVCVSETVRRGQALQRPERPRPARAAAPPRALRVRLMMTSKLMQARPRRPTLYARASSGYSCRGAPRPPSSTRSRTPDTPVGPRAARNVPSIHISPALPDPVLPTSHTLLHTHTHPGVNHPSSQYHHRPKRHSARGAAAHPE